MSNFKFQLVALELWAPQDIKSRIKSAQTAGKYVGKLAGGAIAPEAVLGQHLGGKIGQHTFSRLVGGQAVSKATGTPRKIGTIGKDIVKGAVGIPYRETKKGAQYAAKFATSPEARSKDWQQTVKDVKSIPGKVAAIPSQVKQAGQTAGKIAGAGYSKASDLLKKSGRFFL